MKTVALGKTNLVVTQLAFGALPIQRTEMDLAVRILRKAYDNGITFFDTARAYSDSEQKLGRALAGVRQNVVIATKTWASDAKTAREHLETSLRELRTDYLDIVQLHNPGASARPGRRDHRLRRPRGRQAPGPGSAYRPQQPSRPAGPPGRAVRPVRDAAVPLQPHFLARATWR